MNEQLLLNVEGADDALLIVDNTKENGTCLGYLQSWAGVSDGLDVATGYFDIGALLALDGRWHHLDKVRILMGADTSHRSRKALLEAVTQRVIHELDESLGSVPN